MSRAEDIFQKLIYFTFYESLIITCGLLQLLLLTGCEFRAS